MNVFEFRNTIKQDAPPPELAPPMAALWWDMKGEWARAHDLVDELETKEGMAVHAYLHRKEGSVANADYWYPRAGRHFFHPELEREWEALVTGLPPS
jgi:hypothetical protein